MSAEHADPERAEMARIIAVAMFGPAYSSTDLTSGVGMDSLACADTLLSAGYSKRVPPAPLTDEQIDAALHWHAFVPAARWGSADEAAYKALQRLRDSGPVYVLPADTAARMREMADWHDRHYDRLSDLPAHELTQAEELRAWASRLDAAVVSPKEAQ